MPVIEIQVKRKSTFYPSGIATAEKLRENPVYEDVVSPELQSQGIDLSVPVTRPKEIDSVMLVSDRGLRARRDCTLHIMGSPFIVTTRARHRLSRYDGIVVDTVTCERVSVQENLNMQETGSRICDSGESDIPERDHSWPQGIGESCFWRQQAERTIEELGVDKFSAYSHGEVAARLSGKTMIATEVLLPRGAL